jgi:uncharacterized protein with LGFP repeats
VDVTGVSSVRIGSEEAKDGFDEFVVSGYGHNSLTGDRVGMCIVDTDGVVMLKVGSGIAALQSLKSVVQRTRIPCRA